MDKPFNIVILGGGTAGWMAANLFAKRWGNKVKVTLVESPDVGIIGVGEGSTPSLKRFFEILGIEEHQWMARCQATYKLNIRFNDWSPASGITSYSHPFPAQVDTFTKRAFMVNAQTRRMGLDTHIQPEDFLLNGVLARQGKGPKVGAHFPFKMEYGYHFNSALLGEFLAEYAQGLGVDYQRAHIADITRAENGNIHSLVTDQGEAISADFFVDCTGFAGLLMEKTLGVGFNSYKENLFNDAAVVLQTPYSTAQAANIPVETESTALSAGWCWKIPLTKRFGNGYVYSQDFVSSEQAEQEFRQHLGVLDDNVEVRHLTMKVGQLNQHWSHNCLALGLSQGFIEPLEATALHLVQVSIELFMQKLEAGQFSAQYQAEYNELVSERFERVRDYIVAHYKLNTRNDTEYWRANRDNMKLSDSLKEILHVWYSRGDIAKEIARQNISSHFDEISWHCLLAGYGAFPPLHPNQPGKGDLYQEKDIQAFLAGCALNFQAHAENLSA
ncbi:tryptophan halogenase family protein [Thalassotalea euphylliae]|uniref:Tryptophan 7-halogenase n=1 Tax=Thalassotalea euphylliae TaxID=1655234 RepID=A0A3E0UHZ3_9GAMM|nr:tryptophan halogenase family protein [Thalassotalea euphylliae]REL36500.1 tryptophan 7-halogenase [Thalassotalea euphylliae]